MPLEWGYPTHRIQVAYKSREGQEGNLEIGLGLKFPTGKDDVGDYYYLDPPIPMNHPELRPFIRHCNWVMAERELIRR
jgi:hypothetical protein